MPRRSRSIPNPISDAPTHPFANSAEAWFWFVRCQKLRNDGARFERDSRAGSRPCDPDDIYRIAQRLYRTGRLQQPHLSALVRFGRQERAPDPRLPDERAQAFYWDDALDRMTAPLVARGIVENTENNKNSA